MNEMINIGQIINTHGLKGELKIFPLTDNIIRFKKLKKVYIDNCQKNVTSCKLQNNKVILKIEGIDTIEQGIKYKNKYISVDREDAVKLPEGSYFVSDIIDCIVFDEDGNKIGKVFDVIFTGSNEVYWVKDKKDVLIPALKDIILDININNKKIIIKPLRLWNED